MLKIKRLDHVINDEVYKRLNQQPVSNKMKRRQLAWIGHILRRDKDERLRKYAQLGSTKRGRKAKYFASYIAEIISINTKLTAQEIEGADQQRDSWKKLVIACTPIIYL